jgi:hypothetical protein
MLGTGRFSIWRVAGSGQYRMKKTIVALARRLPGCGVTKRLIDSSSHDRESVDACRWLGLFEKHSE